MLSPRSTFNQLCSSRLRRAAQRLTNAVFNALMKPPRALSHTHTLAHTHKCTQEAFINESCTNGTKMGEDKREGSDRMMNLRESREEEDVMKRGKVS